MSAPGTIEVRFYAELNDFLPPARRQLAFAVELAGSPAVKDLIESLGAPHTEVDLILVNGVPVGFEHRLAAGDRVSVYPVFEAMHLGGLSPLRERPLRDPRFIADVGLAKLARDLRLLGFDTRWSNAATDPEIIDTSLAEHRIILTRDFGILKQSRVTHGVFVRATDPEAQIEELVRRLDLAPLARPFTLCLACGGRIEPVADRAQVEAQLPDSVRAGTGEIRRCAECRQLYWKGSHRAQLQERVDRILAACAKSP